MEKLLEYLSFMFNLFIIIMELMNTIEMLLLNLGDMGGMLRDNMINASF